MSETWGTEMSAVRSEQRPLAEAKGPVAAAAAAAEVGAEPAAVEHT